MFAAAKDMGRYAFHGVLLELDPKEITLVATDGRRLSMARLEIATGVKARHSSIVPVRGLSQLQRAVPDREGRLSITARDDQVRFAVEDTEIVVQIVEGEFPDFRAVLPKKQDTPKEVELDRHEFASAIQRAAVTAGEEARAVELRFDKGTLAVLSRQEGVGEARSEMGIAYQGDAVGIRFNPEFLGEYLKTLPEGALKFRFKDRPRPACSRPPTTRSTSSCRSPPERRGRAHGTPRDDRVAGQPRGRAAAAARLRPAAGAVGSAPGLAARRRRAPRVALACRGAARRRAHDRGGLLRAVL
jgi:DNA polymerase-3 subunit beta